MSDAPSFVIMALDGDPREIRLSGRALPYRPYELEGDQRLAVTWLPGAPEGSASLFGATEKPTQIRGQWKDIFLGASLDSGESPPFTFNGSTVLEVQQATRIMNDTRLLGKLLQVTWLNKVRQGFLIKWRESWHTTHDVEWTAEFEWINRGEPIGAAVFVSSTLASDTASALLTRLSGLDKIGTPDRFSLGGNFLDGLQTFQHTLEDMIDGVTNSIQNFVDSVTTPVQTVRGILATLSGIETQCNDIRTYIEVQFGLQNKPIEQQTYNERLEAAAFQRELMEWYQETRRVAVEQRTQLSNQIKTNVLAIYSAKEGEDLRDVSRLYYGTPFEWRRIMIFNDLNDAELSAGQIILVPRRNPDEAGEDQPGD